MSFPQRPVGSAAPQSTRGSGTVRSIPAYEVLKARIQVKLQDRFDSAKSRRMPASLFQETVRQQVEQVIESEAARLTVAERERMIVEVLADSFGFGPLEELFADPMVMEVLVLGSQAILSRREAGWLPTHVRFRDEDHLAEILERIRNTGEAIGAKLTDSVIDAKMNNGFRAIAVIPPEGIGQPISVAFVRLVDSMVPQANPTPVQMVPSPQASVAATVQGSHGAGTRVLSGPSSVMVGSGRIAAPVSRIAAVRSPQPSEDPLERYRVKITSRLIAKLSSLGVYDLSGFDVAELQKVVAAYVEEYCNSERIYLDPTDQGRLTLEILTGMNR